MHFEKDICVGAIVLSENVCEILDRNMASFSYKQTLSYILKKINQLIFCSTQQIKSNVNDTKFQIDYKNVNLKS